MLSPLPTSRRTSCRGVDAAESTPDAGGTTAGACADDRPDREGPGDRDGAGCALVGPGRAGTTVALAARRRGLVGRRRVAGRAPDAPSARGRGSSLRARAADVADAGAAPTLVDHRDTRRARSEAAARRGRGRSSRARSWCISPARAGSTRSTHLGGARPTSSSARCTRSRRSRRPRPARRASPGPWAGVAGAPAVRTLADELGLTPFELADDDRPATTPPRRSPRTTSLRCSARSSASPRRVGAACRVRPLVRATVDNASRSGPGTRSPGRSRAATSRPSMPSPRRVAADEQRRVPRAGALPRRGSPSATTRSCSTLLGRVLAHERRIQTSSRSPSCAPPATQARAGGRRVGLVPTMGYFHAGTAR